MFSDLNPPPSCLHRLPAASRLCTSAVDRQLLRSQIPPPIFLVLGRQVLPPRVGWGAPATCCGRPTVNSTCPIHPQVPAPVSLRPDLLYRNLYTASCFSPRAIGLGLASHYSKKWVQVPEWKAGHA